jgi:hypothetical protein
MAYAVYSGEINPNGQTRILKAYLQSKSSLSYEINRFKIKSSFRKSNGEYKNIKEIYALEKILQKKIEDLKHTKSLLSQSRVPKIPQEQIEDLIKTMVSSQNNSDETAKILKELTKEQDYLNLLKEKHLYLKETLDSKNKLYKENELKINELKISRKPTNEFEANASYYERNKKNPSQNHNKFNSNPDKIDQTKSKNLSVHSSSIEYIRKSETPNSSFLKPPRKGLANKLEYDNQDTIKPYSPAELNMNLDTGLQSDIKFKRYLSPQVPSSSLQHFKTSKETISLSNLLTGFNEIIKEKDSLIEQNNRLKEKITNLFNI